VVLKGEVIGPPRCPGGASEVVERDRVDPGGGEALGELFVEAMEPADIRRDDDPCIALLGLREESAERLAVLAREDHVLAAGAAADRTQVVRDLRRSRAGREAHRGYPTEAWPT
jgi:hypothetical protein